jgi:hypothetical protein
MIELVVIKEERFKSSDMEISVSKLEELKQLLEQLPPCDENEELHLIFAFKVVKFIDN